MKVVLKQSNGRAAASRLAPLSVKRWNELGFRVKIGVNPIKFVPADDRGYGGPLFNATQVEPVFGDYCRKYPVEVAPPTVPPVRDFQIAAEKEIRKHFERLFRDETPPKKLEKAPVTKREGPTPWWSRTTEMPDHFGRSMWKEPK